MLSRCQAEAVLIRLSVGAEQGPRQALGCCCADRGAAGAHALPPVLFSEHYTEPFLDRVAVWEVCICDPMEQLLEF